MTVAELIAKLQELPQDARVVIDGYEGGLEDVEVVRVIEIIVGSKGPCSDLFGTHEQWFPAVHDRPARKRPHETAVYLPR